MLLKASARRTWCHESAIALNLRRLAEEFRLRGLPLQFWKVRTEDGCVLPETWTVWSPQARSMGVACGFGCGSCRDCEDHIYECIYRRPLRRVRRELFLILTALGLGTGVAMALSHHPSVMGRIPKVHDLGSPSDSRPVQSLMKSFVSGFLISGQRCYPS
eukprot:gene11444-biopygen500